VLGVRCSCKVLFCGLGPVLARVAGSLVKGLVDHLLQSHSSQPTLTQTRTRGTIQDLLVLELD